MTFDTDTLQKLPSEPGVYLMKDERGTILYVGKAKDLKSRVKQYFVPGRDGRTMVPYLTAQIASIDTILTITEKEALLLENTLIKKHKPKYNVLLKDDKTFISLAINHKHPWPMLRLVRHKGRPKGDALHFGPYTSAYAARQTLELMQKIFPLRQCSDKELQSRTRPCLLYGIKRCIAPCVQKCTHEEYDAHLKRAIQFLKGQDREVLDSLKEEMKRASEALEFERAGALHKTIQQIEYVLSNRRAVVYSKTKDCDAFALYRAGDEMMVVQLIFREGRLIGAEHYPFEKIASDDQETWETFLLQHYQKQKVPPEVLLPVTLHQADLLEEMIGAKISAPKRGEKRKLIELAQKNAKALFEQEKHAMSLKEAQLLDLQEALDLNQCPVRIECFDTSNISGTDLVASMITYTDAMRDKAKTKLFIVNGVDKPDDYGALREVLLRHYTKAKEKDDLPDLTMIDGGKGQLNVALDVFRELEIASVDVISLVKEKGRHDFGLTREGVCVPDKSEPIKLSASSSTLFFLQRIRDEAHRAAIMFHRKRRKKRLVKSSLDAIEGIGPKKRKDLLTHFGSLKRVKAASREELEEVKSLTKRDIDRLIDFIEST